MQQRSTSAGIPNRERSRSGSRQDRRPASLAAVLDHTRTLAVQGKQALPTMERSPSRLRTQTSVDGAINQVTTPGSMLLVNRHAQELRNGISASLTQADRKSALEAIEPAIKYRLAADVQTDRFRKIANALDNRINLAKRLEMLKRYILGCSLLPTRAKMYVNQRAAH